MHPVEFASESELARVLAPVALGGEILSYSFARCFHEAYGVKTIVVSAVNVRATSSSRFVDYRVIPAIQEGDAAALAYLRQLGAELRADGKVPIIFGNADWHARLLSMHKDELSEWFIVPYNDFSLQSQITQKSVFYQLCDKLGIAYPKTWRYDFSASSPALDLDALPYPLIAKPSNSSRYDLLTFSGKEKVYTVSDAQELRRVLNVVGAAGYDDEFILQDFIPGDDDSIRTLTTFSDSNGDVRVVSGGRVVLQDHDPLRIGNPMCVLLERTQRVIDDAKRFCRETGYRGFANFDIKFDARNGRYCFFEVNTRPGRNTYYMALGGANIAKLLVDEYVLERPIPYREAYDDMLYTCVPVSVVRRHVADLGLRREVLSHYRNGNFGYPYDYVPDSLLHKVWSKVIWAHQIEKFKRNMG